MYTWTVGPFCMKIDGTGQNNLSKQEQCYKRTAKQRNTIRNEIRDLECTLKHGAVVQYAANLTRNTRTNPFSNRYALGFLTCINTAGPEGCINNDKESCLRTHVSRPGHKPALWHKRLHHSLGHDTSGTKQTISTFCYLHVYLNVLLRIYNAALHWAARQFYRPHYCAETCKV